MSDSQPTGAIGRLPRAWLIIHGLIIAWLGIESIYAAWQIFVVLQPPGVIGPMLGHAKQLPYEAMVVRRMYAEEAWTAFGLLAVYLAITEILPRRLRLH